MRLTKGITGIDSAHLIEQELQSFQGMVYHLVTSMPKAKVVQFVDDPSNVYMSAKIQIDEESLIILHHRYMPYVAFAENREDATFHFLTTPHLHKFFPMRKCLEAADLNTSIEQDEHLHSLSEVEWEYVKKYHCATIGEVLFNNWNRTEIR